mgnify:FL=1|jgi:hypothetical protein
MTILWIAEPGALRSIDFANTEQVVEIRIGPEDRLKGPKYFLDALRPTFEQKQPAATLPAAKKP